jgi:alginate production protein
MTLRHKTLLTTGAAALALLLAGIAQGATPPASEEGEALARTPRELARLLGVSEDDVRPDSQRSFSLFGAPVTLGGEMEASSQADEGFDLDADEADRRVRALPEFKLEARIMPSERMAAFVQAKAYLESDLLDQGGTRSHDSGLRLDQAWLMFPDLLGTGLGLQVGRQKFQDRREWWWDEDMEAVRVHFGNSRTSGFVAMAERLWSGDASAPLAPDERHIRHLMATVSKQVGDRRELDFFVLHSQDRSGAPAAGQRFNEDAVDEDDARLTWLGARYRGRHKLPSLGKLYLMLDMAVVDGREDSTDFVDAGNDELISGATSRQNVRGWAVDGWASWELPIDLEPYLTFGYAYGSATSPGSTTGEGDFRQTGLHGNNGKYRGISRFRFYGEALRPDLVNLQVATAALGVPLGPYAWVEAVYHRYRQVQARDSLPGSRLDVDPTGESRNLGSEFDLVVSFEYQRRWEAELSIGAFRAGPAFGDATGSWARAASFKLNYNF